MSLSLIAQVHIKTGFLWSDRYIREGEPRQCEAALFALLVMRSAFASHLDRGDDVILLGRVAQVDAFAGRKSLEFVDLEL